MEGLPLLIVLLVIVVVLMIGSIIVTHDRKLAAEEISEAGQEYQRSLATLRSNPTNADLRQMTLQLGRIYSNLTRDKKGVTVYDEVALMNDINAACAASATISKGKAANEQTIEERLAKLSELRSKGVIDDQEYTSKRLKILDEV